MSDPAAAQGLTEADKVDKYSYLLPGAPAGMEDKMASETPGSAAEAPEAESSPELSPADWPAPDAAAARDRARGCLLGLAIGDAIGAPVEFKPRDSFPPLTGMTGGGPFKLQPGQWTDDTTMALCLAESILQEGEVDQPDLMQRLGRWLTAGENSVTGTCFDIGATTRAAIERFLAGGSAAAGSADPASAGNGSLTRLAPVAIAFRHDRSSAEFMALKQSRATHAAADCLSACKLLTSMLIDALSGAGARDATRPRVLAVSPKVLFINAGEWRTKSRDEIRSSGYVIDTLEAAVWAVGTTDSFEAAVLAAANLGDDADSVAAVAGQLAGAVYGASAIPQAWLDTLAWRDKIEILADRLFYLAGSDP
jgi:ADP-ribosyl-[dinitrogen reductase] hydrolase